MSKLKIAISGIGAVGGYYGAMMILRYKEKQIADFYFISRGDNLRAIQERGLQARTGIRTITAIPTLATDNPAEIGPVDYVFCCTKSYNLKENILQLKPLLGPETVIIPLQNGINITEQIQELLPGQPVWKGCTYIGSRLIRPGYVEKFSGKERLFFGSENGDEEKQKTLLTLLTNAHIKAYNPKDMNTRIWKKFMMISPAATITSFFNQNIGQVIDQHYDMFVTLSSELKNVAEAKGIQFPGNIVYKSIEAQKMMPANATTSMHSDFLLGKPTELETLTGYVVRTAEELGIEVPTYKFMYKGLAEIPYPRS
ncbi:ketopantoate reductase family protein [Parabacteroides bouchesdurhonensis]|uniref:ketopantoate reductase family protein n=1 Tax=Parabacteroides bouchesdurhonensis TaxID=1936995 RepID=UPI000C81C41F|nr:2-dehydropantoate 2-reductase [Parabacteroides bouchesdurhonensis]RHJ92587.1 2-dehydropantoate 2-reductase [Bacteroides sp. AM07-16]